MTPSPCVCVSVNWWQIIVEYRVKRVQVWDHEFCSFLSLNLAVNKHVMMCLALACQVNVLGACRPQIDYYDCFIM